MPYALRLLKKSPLFTSVAVLTLALGIGANTAIFSMVYGVLLKQLPFQHGSRLVWIWGTHNHMGQTPYSIPNFLDLRESSRALDGVAAHADQAATLTGAGEPERVIVARVSANAFQLLGVSALFGRTLVEADGQPNSERVMVVTYGLWKRRFGGVPDILGQKLILDGAGYTVIGVLPREFTMPATTAELFVPLVFEMDPLREHREFSFLRIFGRLSPGVTRRQAAAELGVITRQLRERYPESNGTRTDPSVLSFQDQITGGYRATLWTLLGSVAVVLLISCSNLANLLLARASARDREMAIRSALGATKLNIVRQLFFESLLLAGIGGALGTVLAKLGLRLLIALSPSNLPRATEVQLDFPVLLFAIGVTLGCAVLFGLAPALRAGRVGIAEAMNGRGAARGRNSTVRSALAVAEIALSVVLLLSAGLLFKSFLRMQAADPGFTPDHLLLVRLSLPRGSYDTPIELRSLYWKVRQRVEALPGVESLSLITHTPLSGVSETAGVEISGWRSPSPLEQPIVEIRWVASGYFHTMRTPLIEGRDVADHDLENSSGVAVVDQAFARKFWPAEPPLGHHLRLQDRDFEVVGVVGNIKHKTLADGPNPTVYAPMAQATAVWVPYVKSNFTFVVRTRSEPEGLITAVRRALRSADVSAPPATVRIMSQFVASALGPSRFSAEITMLFAGIALLLSAMGLYSVVAYLVSLRTGEFGVRIAIGAGVGDILRIVMQNGFQLVVMGECVGLPVAAVVAHAISNNLYQTNAADLSIYMWVCASVVSLSALALYIPARRATRIDPAITLRS